MKTFCIILVTMLLVVGFIVAGLYAMCYAIVKAFKNNEDFDDESTIE